MIARSLLLCAAIVSAAIAEGDPVRRIAALPLSSATSSDSLKSAQDGLRFAEQIGTFMAHSKQIVLVERAQIDKAASEIALGQTGLIDESQAVQAGKMSGANELVLGSYGRKAGSFSVNLRLVNAETGEVRAASTTSGPRERRVLESASAELLNATGVAVKHDPAFKARRIAGFLLLAAGAGGAAFGTVSHFTYVQADKDYTSSYNLTASEYSSLHDKAERFQNTRLYGWSGGGVGIFAGALLLLVNRSEWKFPAHASISPVVNRSQVGLAFTLPLAQ